MWLESLTSGSSAGHVNVPDAATLVSQLFVALVALVQSVNATSTELSDVQPLNMLE